MPREFDSLPSCRYTRRQAVQKTLFIGAGYTVLVPALSAAAHPSKASAFLPPTHAQEKAEWVIDNCYRLAVTANPGSIKRI